jgi:hypothetical protein
MAHEHLCICIYTAVLKCNSHVHMLKYNAQLHMDV